MIRRLRSSSPKKKVPDLVPPPNPQRKLIHSANLRVRYSSKNPRELDAVEEALFLETTRNSKSKMKGRCLAKVSRVDRGAGSFLEVDFTSRELVSLRAALNTNLRLVATALRTLGELERTEKD